MVNYLDRVAISFAGPKIMESLSLTHAQFGIVLSSFGVGYALALIPGGFIVDRVGVRLMCIVGPLAWAFFTGLTGLVSTTIAFVAVRFCFGVSEGLFGSSQYKAVGDYFEPKERAGILAICLTSLAVGPALAGPLVGTLVTNYSWQAMFGIMAVPAVLASLAAYLLFPRATPVLADEAERGVHPVIGEKVPFKDVLKQPSLWLVSFVNFSQDIAQWGFLGWMPSYLAMERHIDLKHAGYFGSIPYVFAFFGLLIGGWLGSSARFHHLRCQMVVIGLLVAALSLFLAYNSDTLILAVVGLSATSLFLFGAAAPKGAVVIGLAPAEHRGAYSATYTTAGHIGGAISPALIGFTVTASGSFATGFTLMTGALCVAALCMAALVPMLKKQRVRAPTPEQAVVEAL